MNPKDIIALVGNRESRKIATQILKEQGYYVVSIDSKVFEFASQFFEEEELDNHGEQIISEFRERGKKAHQHYWLNLVMIGVPDDKERIVISDANMDEVVNTPFRVLYLTDGINNEVQNNERLEVINYDGNNAEFTKKIHDIL